MKRTTLRISADDCGIGHDLICPGCQSVNLHHERVEVFNRYGDDYDAPGRRVVVEHTDLRIDSDMKTNPSRRRSGVRIHFWCECCLTLSALTIAQHKGTTYLDMEITGERPDEFAEVDDADGVMHD